MRKISMKRKSKAVENTEHSGSEVNNEFEQDSNSGVESEDSISNKSKTRRSKAEVSFAETKGRKSKSDHVDESGEIEGSNSEEEKKNRKGKKSKMDHVDESNGTEKTNTEEEKKNKKGRKSKSIYGDESNGAKETNSKDKSYEVEQVIDQKFVKGAKHYLIRWKGYGKQSDTWEPENTLDCPDLVSKFLSARKSEDSSKNKKGKKRGSSPNKSPKKIKVAEESGGEEEVGEYEVDRILDVHFKKNGKREFFVHWKGYNANDNTWEPEENMKCFNLIEKFMEKVTKARESELRELRVNPKPTKYFTLSMQQTGRRLSRRHIGKQRAQYQELE